MFPTLNHLLYYLFHFKLPFPIQTLGFFIALAFTGAYWVFTSELKRYEASGKIAAFKRTVAEGIPASFTEIVINALLGFVLGFKIIGAVLQYSSFQNNPRNYLLSLQGNIIGGLLTGILFSYWVFVDRKRNLMPTPLILQKVIHPYQLMGRIVLAVGVAGVLGSKLFDVVEHLDQLWYHPIETLFNNSGFAYYGGLLFGALTFFYIGHRNGMRIVHLADIGSPGMMLAYGVGRIGCQLSGDGDWGKINNHLQPEYLRWLPCWMWSFRFPHNVINAGLPIPGCEEYFCNMLPQGVYPTSFYEATLCISLFLLMWTFRYAITTPGLMFCLYLVLNGFERFTIEFIRINARYHIGGLALTQAQILGALMMITSIAGFIYIKRKTTYR